MARKKINNKEKEMKYQWKRTLKGAPKAQVAGEYLQAIKDSRGVLTQEIIVSEARKRKSPLHDCFEWNDAAAAVEHRKAQAREILRFLVVVETEDVEDCHVRAFISPSDVGQKSSEGYFSVSEVADDKALGDAYKQKLLTELLAIQEKIRCYKEFSAVVNAIDAVVL